MAHDWLLLTPAERLHLPPRLRGWIALDTSMTARIGQVAQAPVTVQVLRQQRARLHPDEARFFPDALARPVVREVCLSCAGKPLLIARSVFTDRRLQDHPVILTLGDRPLGSLLFADGPPPVTAREYARLGPGAPLFALVRRRHRGLRPDYWARRTLYGLFGAPVLVTEIFLPALLARDPAPLSPEQDVKAG